MAPLSRPIFGRILVASDFSHASERAWQRAEQLAQLHGAELLLTHVDMPHPTSAPAGLKRDADAQVSRLEARLAEWAAPATERGLTVKTILRHGDPAEMIAEVAREMGADLIVLGAHGVTPLAGILIGSVAERVARAASCSVMIVKSDSAVADRAA